MKITDKTSILLIIFISCIIAIYPIVYGHLHDWDEARNGINALEMLVNGDFINFHYNMQPDTWNVKPPLFIWSVVASYKIFGFNAFALRFPVFIAMTASLIVGYKLIRLYKSEVFSLGVIIALSLCKGIWGVHVGLTGDFDAFLTLFLLLLVYYIIQYTITDNNKYLIIAALFWGLAFLTKGTAAFIILPGIVLFLLAQKGWSKIFKNPYIYITVFIALLFPIAWMIINQIYGIKFENGYVGSKSAVQTMFLYDTFDRFTNSTEFGSNEGSKIESLLSIIDIRLYLAGYIFIIALLGIISVSMIHYFKIKENLFKDNPFLQLCLIISITTLLVLTLAEGTHHWYYAPYYLYYIIIAGLFIEWIIDRYPNIKYILPILFLLQDFYLAKETFKLYSDDMNTVVSSIIPMLKKDEVEVLLPNQSLFLRLKWEKPDLIYSNSISKNKNYILTIEKQEIENYELVQSVNNIFFLYKRI
ncbi:MAG: glycosyltransferase family 39 protein [Cytophagaceae bacterium]